MTADAVVRGILLDLDGTLLDTAPDLVTAVNHTLEQAGLPPCPAPDIIPLISEGAAAMLRRGLGLHADRLDQWLDHMLDFYESHVAVQTRYFDGIETLLNELDQADVPWGIVTNKLARFTRPLLAAVSLDGRTRCVISGDTTAERKPHPLPLLEAARRLALAPGECAYIGDSRADMEAGRRAGMKTIAALYGYLKPEDKPEDWPADEFIPHPNALIARLRESGLLARGGT